LSSVAAASATARADLRVAMLAVPQYGCASLSDLGTARDASAAPCEFY